MSVTYSETPTGLLFTADTESREEIAAADNDYGVQLDLVLSDVLGNGLEMLQAEEVGALTDSEIFALDAVRDDQGTLTDAGRVFWFPDYMIRNPWDDLATTGSVLFHKSNDQPNPTT